jgi:hypothetical protein
MFQQQNRASIWGSASQLRQLSGRPQNGPANAGIAREPVSPMFTIIGRPRQVQELRDAQAEFDASKRSSVPMLLIDDEEFPYLEDLQQHEFRIKAVPDIDDIHAVEAYSIILCDITGVGKKFKSDFQGAHLISEIRKFYPSKVIIAYTGQQFDARFNAYFKLADRVIKKDIDGERWIEFLDEAIRDATDPVVRWEKLRDHLIHKGISLKTVMTLEDAYVKAVQAGDDKFPNPKLLKGLTEEQKALMTRFAATTAIAIVHHL